MRRIDHRRKDSGKILALVAVCLIPIFSLMALSLDGGQMLARRRGVQAAADAAALAAAGELFYRHPHNQGLDSGGYACASAKSVAAANGYADDGVDSAVSVNIPPLSGDYAGRAGFVEVTVCYFHRRSFSNILARGPLPVRARSIASGAPMPADVGILVLNPSAPSALNAQGGGLTTVSGAPVVVNSSSPEGLTAGGGSVRAPTFDLTGGYTTSGGGGLDGPIRLNRPATKDPFAYLPVPDTLGMVTRSAEKAQYTSGLTDLEPGVYVGGLSASGSASLKLNPGVYYMDQGGFSFSGQGNLYGDGVMIYLVPNPENGEGLNISGQGTIYLTPIKDGPHTGFTVFQGRSSTVSGGLTGSGPGTNITGTFYLAGARLNVTGNGGASVLGSQYVSDSLSISGGSPINVPWNPNTVARKRTIVLAE